MIQDRALTKVIKSERTAGLSPDFNSRLMNRVCLESQKQTKRSSVLGLCAISGASLSLISLAIYLLKDYLTFSFHLPVFLLSRESLALYGFSFYIAFLIFILVTLDNYFRHKRMIKKQDNPA
ncbi:MAG: hypothetical protein Q8904_11515 [Bacteroidota bacterium]|nr:hypothetical protein [Bacteroidota bacterium]